MIFWKMYLFLNMAILDPFVKFQGAGTAGNCENSRMKSWMVGRRSTFPFWARYHGNLR